jgi:hypothetical protein
MVDCVMGPHENCWVWIGYPNNSKLAQRRTLIDIDLAPYSSVPYLPKKYIFESNVERAIDQRGSFGVDVRALNLKVKFPLEQ